MSSSSGPAVQVEDLVKVYPGGTRAVAGIDFGVRRGEFVGFLGPNGAGKSTTLKILATLLKKTSGRVLVGGFDVDRDPMEIRGIVGFAMQEVGLDDLAPGREFLETQGLLYGLARKDARERAAELLELVGLTSVGGRKVATYSGGMRRRIDLAGALMHRPPILFLDEPTTGLDPQSRLAIWGHLQELNESGVTVFLTTQTMEEADRLCQRIAIIDLGTIVAEGSPDELKREVGGDVVTITVGGGEDGTGKAEEAVALARERTYVGAVTTERNILAITVDDAGSAVPDLLRLFIDRSIPVGHLEVSSPTLDDVFLKHTGRTIRASEGGGSDMDQAWRQLMGLGRR